MPLLPPERPKTDPHRDPGKRVTYPRPVEPSPEGQWPIPAKTEGPDASPGPDVRQPEADDPEDAGLVDPRPEAAGPDIAR